MNPEQIQQIEQESEKLFPHFNPAIMQYGKQHNLIINRERQAYKAGRLKSDEQKDKRIAELIEQKEKILTAFRENVEVDRGKKFSQESWEQFKKALGI